MAAGKQLLVVDYQERVVWLDGEITAKTAKIFRAIMTKLNKKRCSPIGIYVRGPGGNIFACLEMMDEIDRSSSPVFCVGHGYLRSGSFLLIQAAARRLAVAKTRFTFHKAGDHSSIYKNVSSVKYTQAYYQDRLEKLRLIDAVQLRWFLKRSKQAEKLMGSFHKEATIGIKQAQELGVLDNYFKDKEFKKDRRVIKRILRNG